MISSNNYLFVGAGIICLIGIVFLLRVLWRQRSNKFGKGVVSRFYYFVCVSSVVSLLASGLFFAVSSLVDTYQIILSPELMDVLVALFRFFFAVMCIGLAFSPGIGIILFAIRSIFEGKSVYTGTNRMPKYVGNPIASLLGFFYLLIGLVVFVFPIWLVVAVTCWKNDQGLCKVGNKSVESFAGLIQGTDKVHFLIAAFCLWIVYLGYRKYKQRKKKTTSSNK